jgi:hypothetical protein
MSSHCRRRTTNLLRSDQIERTAVSTLVMFNDVRKARRPAKMRLGPSRARTDQDQPIEIVTFRFWKQENSRSEQADR